jgi:RNA-directed DNA polymerase
LSWKPEAEGHAEGAERRHAINKDNADAIFFSSMLEEILDYRNVQKALKQVISNGGASGIDGMQTDELRDYLESHWTFLKASILDGSYCPRPVREVTIPKPNGGTRTLGIPTVIDRLLQQAVYQWLSPQYEPTFSVYSYGFRPGRNAHQAVLQARSYLDEGKTSVIELDLDKFFDRMNHDKLMGLLSQGIGDKRTLKLIRSYLSSGILEGGLINARMEGTPQGSPLSPLLSNVLLNELDKELSSRGHSFVRYADDCSIYVRSEKSAHRVQTSIIVYIEKRLKLKVNRAKTKVSRPHQSSLLGFSFYKVRGSWRVRISSGSLKRIKERIRSHTQRKSPGPAKEKIRQLDVVIRGWVSYFRLAQSKWWMGELDKLVRMRLSMGIWKQWKNGKTRERNLRLLGVNKYQASMWGRSGLGYCRVAHSQILRISLNKEYFQRLGYVGFYNYYYWKTEHQTKLF